MNVVLKKIKKNISNASLELSKIKDIFSSNYTVNGLYIEKNNIDKLDENFKQIILSIDNYLSSSINNIDSVNNNDDL